MKRSAILLAIGAALVLAANVNVWASASASIKGVVTGSGSPLSGAMVYLKGPVAKRTTTDTKGEFVFEALPAGNYTIRVVKTGYRKVMRKVKLSEGKEVKLSIRLVFLSKLKQDSTRPSAKAVAVSADELAEAPRPKKVMPRKRARGRLYGHKSMKSFGRGVIGGGAYPGEPPVSSTEQYVDHGVRQWEITEKDRLSTFSIDVDTASYTIARRKLLGGMLPPPAAVRTEEFVNYFHYNYAPPKHAPFAVHMEASPSPFEKSLHILRIGIKGKDAKGKTRKPVHLTFLVDTSGSMHSADKMGLVKRSLRFLVDQLKAGDTVALCTYAGSVREVLKPTGMDKRAKIHEAIEDLTAGGSTAMSSGLELAYKLASKNFKKNSVNRVIVCSDGDANVGATRYGDMLKSISIYAKKGITLSTLGFGMGNYKDHRMEQLADKGNGNYYYIDTISEAKKVFGSQLMGTLQVIAKDVKIQVEFDPKYVKKYRLIGYENRNIADRDFRNDKVDAGEIGAGHTVTALYELQLIKPNSSFATVRIRWKKPQGKKASEKAYLFSPKNMKKSFKSASADFKRAVAAAALAENLRNSPFKESWTIKKAEQIAKESLSREDKQEMGLIALIQKAANLMGSK